MLDINCSLCWEKLPAYCLRKSTALFASSILLFEQMKAEELSSTVSCRTVDLIYLNDVEDIYRSSQERCLVLRRSRRGPSVTFDYSDCEVLLKVGEDQWHYVITDDLCSPFKRQNCDL